MFFFCFWLNFLQRRMKIQTRKLLPLVSEGRLFGSLLLSLVGTKGTEVKPHWRHESPSSHLKPSNHFQKFYSCTFVLWWFENEPHETTITAVLETKATRACCFSLSFIRDRDLKVKLKARLFSETAEKTFQCWKEKWSRPSNGFYTVHTLFRILRGSLQ